MTESYPLRADAAIAFVASHHLDRSLAFYTGRLGLVLQEMTPAAVVLRAGGTQVRVTHVEAFTPQPFTVFGWQVADLAGRVDELGAAGIEFERFPGLPQDERGIWATPGGDRVAWFRDPDGNILSLTQYA